jgi:Family of unknown function (DUF6445)
MALPEPKISVRRLGREGEPLVVIDGFSGMVDTLKVTGYAAQYLEAGAFYPGMRSRADSSYLNRRRELMMQIMQQVFGFTEDVRLDAASYSLVTLAEQDLSPLQCIPHYDDTGSEVIAVMHYLLGPETGGTAFYRHRRTGFETINAARETAYREALTEDEKAYGLPPARYYHGDSDWFEQIDEVDAQPDRLILYRGRQLHSGVIPDPAVLSPDPRQGRLTINMFLIGA